MNNYKFTKGKWNYEKGTYLENTIFFHFNNGEIIKVSNINDNDEATEETKANALLISKSPILLQAIYDSIEPLKKAGLKEMADYHEKIYLESVNL